MPIRYTNVCDWASQMGIHGPDTRPVVGPSTRRQGKGRASVGFFSRPREEKAPVGPVRRCPRVACLDLLLRTLLICAASSTWGFASPAPKAEATKEQVLSAMKKATDFMMNVVSNRGGFLWHYNEDFSKQWGEIPARKSQIWVQPPGSTTNVGLMLLEAFGATTDPEYLKYAEKVAGALIWGQHPSGGWHYFIDFDPAGIPKFYKEVASQCRGWEEFYHYYGNATFDDDTTASATRFLLRLYANTLDPKYRPPLLQALDFILKSQYPNGAWPQRYPLRYDYPHDGHADYTSFYTFNDEVISNNIYLLLEAYEKLGNEEHLRAAHKGMDFYILSQSPSPQAGWALQYDMEMKPAWARSYEPAALCSGQTVQNIKDLERFYMITGDRRYLEPIPGALQWLEDSFINKDPSKKFTHATFYEVGSNKPLYARHEVRDGKIVSYRVGYEKFDLPAYGGHGNIDVAALRREFETIRSLNPQTARAEYRGREEAKLKATMVDSQTVQKLMDSMDDRGAWMTNIKFLDTDNYADNPPIEFKGIDTDTYISNMGQLINYLEKLKSADRRPLGSR
jgi:PelA/Pel-15E family pectate lyase